MPVVSTTPALSAASALPAAFHPIGGVMSGDDLALALRPAFDQPVSRVAQWIARRRVVNFVWRAQFMLPAFQFDAPTMLPRADVGEVIAELVDVYDDQEIAAWFATPNPWLDNQTPASALDRDPKAVVQAARTDRFIANG